MKGKMSTNYWCDRVEYSAKRSAQSYLEADKEPDEKTDKEPVANTSDIHCIQSCACTTCNGTCSKN